MHDLGDLDDRACEQAVNDSRSDVVDDAGVGSHGVKDPVARVDVVEGMLAADVLEAVLGEDILESPLVGVRVGRILVGRLDLGEKGRGSGLLVKKVDGGGGVKGWLRIWGLAGGTRGKAAWSHVSEKCG